MSTLTKDRNAIIFYTVSIKSSATKINVIYLPLDTKSSSVWVLTAEMGLKIFPSHRMMQARIIETSQISHTVSTVIIWSCDMPSCAKWVCRSCYWELMMMRVYGDGWRSAACAPNAIFALLSSLGLQSKSSLNWQIIFNRINMCPSACLSQHGNNWDTRLTVLKLHQYNHQHDSSFRSMQDYLALMSIHIVSYLIPPCPWNENKTHWVLTGDNLKKCIVTSQMVDQHRHV